MLICYANKIDKKERLRALNPNLEKWIYRMPADVSMFLSHRSLFLIIIVFNSVIWKEVISAVTLS